MTENDPYFEWLAASSAEAVKKEEAEKYIQQYLKGLLTVRDLAMQLFAVDEKFSI